MNDYHARIEAAGLLEDFQRARETKNKPAMAELLRRAGFNPLEIDSVLWAGGEIAGPPTETERARERRDEILGRIGMAVVTGVVVGVIFVYVSLRLDRRETRSERMERLSEDFRTPRRAIYKPFVWGFGAGAVLGFVTAEGFLIGLMKGAWGERRD